MKKSPFRLILVTILLGLLVVPPAIVGQCMFTTNTMSAGIYIAISKTFTGGMSYVCTNTMSNVQPMGCYPSPGDGMKTVSFLIASALKASAMTMFVSCAWDCACESNITVDSTDGLPVELMDFAIEGESEEL